MMINVFKTGLPWEIGHHDKNIEEVLDCQSGSVLELGCGTGPLGAEMIDWGYSVEFSDYSDVLVKRLQREFGYKVLPANCRNLSFAKDNSYDVILLAGTVYNFENYFSKLVEVCY